MSTAAQTSAQAEQTHDEFMMACMADGTDKETCEARWQAAHQSNPEVTPQQASPADAANLLREIEMLKARLQVREDQLKQAIDIANRANNEAKAKEDAEKEMLIKGIQMDSDYKESELTSKNLNDLRTIRLTLDKTMAKTFASVAADIAEQNRRKAPRLTAGAWDPEKQRWVGGI